MVKGSIKEQVYESILKEILDGEVDIDSTINERIYSEKFNVSKTPVREALVQLCSEGILKNIPRYGYRIVEINPYEIIEIIEYRKIVEVGALKLSFPFIDDERISFLRKINEKSEKDMQNSDIHLQWKNNETFHRELSNMCPNRYIQKSIHESLSICTRFANQYFEYARKDKTLDASSHYKLIEAIEKKDFLQAKNALEFDIEQLREKLADRRFG